MPPIKINKDLPAIAQCTLLRSTPEGRLKVSFVKVASSALPLHPHRGPSFVVRLGASPSAEELSHLIHLHHTSNSATLSRQRHSNTQHIKERITRDPQVDSGHLICHSLHGGMFTVTCRNGFLVNSQSLVFEDPAFLLLPQPGRRETSHLC